MATINALPVPAHRPQPQPAPATAPQTAVPASASDRPNREPALPAPETEPLETKYHQQLADALDRLGEALAKVRPDPYSVGFERDEASGVTVIQIKDASGKVVKQFPPEKILNLHQKMDDLVGMIVDETT